MAKDYRTWWRDWGNGGRMMKDMEPLTEELREAFGSWQFILNQLGLADADAAIEQLWAIREDLA